MTESNLSSDKLDHIITDKEYLAKILRKLEEIAGMLREQTRLLQEVKRVETDYRDEDYGPGVESRDDEDYPGYQEDEGYGDDGSGGDYGEEEENEDPQDDEGYGGSWEPEEDDYREDESEDEDEKEDYQEESAGEDPFNFFRTPEVTGKIEKKEDPDARFKPTTPRCPTCGMITQFYEGEEDYYCWMCDRYLSEMNEEEKL